MQTNNLLALKMTENHSFPITPPPELVQRLYGLPQMRAIEAAFQAGADWELKACCAWLPKLPPWSADDLQRHRRPKPPSLKEQALIALKNGKDDNNWTLLTSTEVSIIRQALELLHD
jgi:hypothetical protein